MTKTVKRRLQAVVALLVSLMIMVGIMPTDILSTTVYAADNTTQADAEEMKTGWSWLYVQLDSQLVNGNSNMAGKVLGAWGNPRIVSKSSMVAITKPTGWGNVYAYGFESWPSSIKVVASGSYSGYDGYSSITLNSPTAGHIYKLMCDGGGGYMKYKDIATYSDLVEDAGGDEEEEIDETLAEEVTVNANFFDYFDDSQYSASTTNESGTKPSSKGNLRRPYQYFNEYISGSSYAIGTSYPLYLGGFWSSNDTKSNNSLYSTTQEASVKSYNNNTYDAATNAGYAWDKDDAGSVLSKFSYRTNLALRLKQKGNDYDTESLNAVVQGLLPTETISYLDSIPYFNANLLQTNNVGKGFEREFKFNKKPVSLSSAFLTYSGSGTKDYYVFDSENDNYRITSTGVSYTDGAVKDIKGKVGFFPFNKTSEQQSSTLNYGFGMKFCVNFKLTTTGEFSDGTPMIFKFKGDDDVWVFLDDTLVLDLGGAHKEAQGEINFSENASSKIGVKYYTDTSTRQIFYAYDTSGTYNKAAGISYLKLKSYANDGYTVNATVANAIDACRDGKTHKLTMFYMERGMIDSNLYIQYNMIPVEDSLTVKEVTDGFDQVNPGLQALTRKAADYDVFTYNVQAAASTRKTNKVLVTDNTLTRTVVGKTDAFTTSGTVGTAYSYDTLGSPAYLANVGYRWGDDFASISPNSTYKYMSGVTNASGYFDLLYGTDAKSSYAKFENQIGRDRVIVGQQANLKKSVSGTISTTTRSVPTYYEVSVPGYDDETNDADSHKTAVATSSNTNPTGVGFTANNGAPIADFMFGLSPTYSADDAVNVTLTFRNTVKKYNITVQKSLVDTNGQTVSNNTDDFTFKLTLENILGIDEVDVAADGYGGITITKGESSDSLNADGTFTAKASETVIIGNIPAGTTYSIYELDGNGNNLTDSNRDFSIGGNNYKLKSATNYASPSGGLSQNVTVAITNELQDEETPSVDIGIIKRWYPLNSSTTLPTEIKFLLQKKSSSGDWEDVQKVTLHTSGTSNVTVKKYDDQNTEVTGSGAYEYAQWTLSTRITVPKDTDVQYRILEYSEGDKALILLNEGLYATDCKAYYKDGNNDTNVKALSAATYANNTELVAWLVENNKIVSGADESAITAAVQALTSAEKTTLTNANITANPVVDLSVKNEYIPMGTAMPKTGARGVYAIVAFGAFAITIAGVALLIYRKKLQTVNIYAVKGSEKKKE